MNTEKLFKAKESIWDTVGCIRTELDKMEDEDNQETVKEMLEYIASCGQEILAEASGAIYAL